MTATGVQFAILLIACMGFILSFGCFVTVISSKKAKKSNDEHLSRQLDELCGLEVVREKDRECWLDAWRKTHQNVNSVLENIEDLKHPLRILSLENEKTHGVLALVNERLTKDFEPSMRATLNAINLFEDELKTYLDEKLAQEQQTLCQVITSGYKCLTEKLRILEQEMRATLDTLKRVSAEPSDKKKWQTLEDAFAFATRNRINGDI